MGWLTGAIGIVGAVSSLVGGNSDRKRARRAERRGNAAEEAMAERIRKMEERFEQYYAPIEQQVSAELQEGPDLAGEANRARGDYGLSFDRSMDAARRQQRRYGLDPTSMQAQRFEEDLGYERAAGMATAANQARTEEDDRHFARQVSFMGAGQGLPAQAANFYGNTADRAYGRASQYGQDAAAGFGAFGQFASIAGNAFGIGSKTTSVQPPTKFASTGTGGLNANQVNAHKQYGLSRLQGYS